jgi:glycosyltransferase involved in cell wall biosynthesis
LITLSVVTVTLNAAHVLPSLIASLRAQTDGEFSWAVFDGGSTDNTMELIRDCKLPTVRVTSGRDFGIYDALNQCLRGVDTEYYLVCGADDVLHPEAIAQFRRAAASSHADLVAASVQIENWVLRPRQGKGWLLGMPGVASSHSVGMLIRRSLHDRFGVYSRKLPIAADQLFVKTAIGGGATIHRADFIAGRYSSGGTSGADLAGMLTEAFRVQLATERGKFLQVALFIARLLKHYRGL